MGITQRLTREFRLACEGIACDRRAKLGLAAYHPLGADTLARDMGVLLVRPRNVLGLEQEHVEALEASDNWSAATVALRPPLVVFNPRHLGVRRESDLMHEFAHMLLGHPMASIDPTRGHALRCPAFEDEATYLGGCLQVPRRGLLWAKQRGMTCHETAQHFGASEEMLRFRCNITGVP